MSETFVPLASATPNLPETGFASFTAANPAPAAPATAGAVPGSGATAAPGPGEACAKPTVTLQRNGDIVSGIRVQCSCGQVVELTCVY